MCAIIFIIIKETYSMDKQEAINRILTLDSNDLERVLAKLSLDEIEKLLEKIEEKGDNDE